MTCIATCSQPQAACAPGPPPPQLRCAQAKKHYKAHVTATAGTKNQAFLEELGADERIDYTKACFASLLQSHTAELRCTAHMLACCRMTGWRSMPRSRLTPYWYPHCCSSALLLVLTAHLDVCDALQDSIGGVSGPRCNAAYNLPFADLPMRASAGNGGQLSEGLDQDGCVSAC